jgi:hypothetical protein
MKKHKQIFFGALVSILASQAAVADSSATVNPIPLITEEWKYSVTPYAWLPGVSADIPNVRSDASADISAGDVLRHLDGAAMISGQANYGRWGLMADIAHAELSKQGVHGRNLGINTSFSVKLTTYTAAFTYNLVNQPDLSIDSVVGLRNVNATVGWNINLPNLPDPVGSKKANATDPILGVKGRHRIAAGNRTDATWQAMAGVGKAYSWGDVMLGYRALYYDMKYGEPLQKTTLAGFTLGLGFKF